MTYRYPLLLLAVVVACCLVVACRPSPPSHGAETGAVPTPSTFTEGE